MKRYRVTESDTKSPTCPTSLVLGRGRALSSAVVVIGVLVALAGSGARADSAPALVMHVGGSSAGVRRVALETAARPRPGGRFVRPHHGRVRHEVYANDEIRVAVPSRVKGCRVVVSQGGAPDPATALYRTLLTVASNRSNFSGPVDVVLERKLAEQFDPRFVADMMQAMDASSLRLVTTTGAKETGRARFETERVPLRSATVTRRRETTGEPLLWGGASHPGLVAELSQQMGIPSHIVNLGGTFNAQLALPENPRGREVILVQSKRVGDPEQFHRDLLESFYTAWCAQRTGAARVTLVLPYLPYSRSDRMDASGTTVGAALIAKMAKAAGVGRVVTFSVHQPQEIGFFQALKIPVAHGAGEAILAPAVARSLAGQLSEGTSVQDQLKVVAPDAGAAKRARMFAKLLANQFGVPSLDVVVAGKERNGDQVVTHFDANVRGKTLVVIDDETASGSTLGQLAEAAKHGGSGPIIAAVSHLTGTADKARKSPYLDKLFVTDTLPATVGAAPDPKLERVNISTPLALMLRNLGNTGVSVDELMFYEH